MGYDFGKNIAELWAPEIMWSARDKTYYLAFSVMEKGVGGKTWLYRSTTGKAEGPYANVTKVFSAKGLTASPLRKMKASYSRGGAAILGSFKHGRRVGEGKVGSYV